MPLFDLKLTFAENGVDFTRDLLAFIFVFSGATNVINVDMGSEFLRGFRVLLLRRLAKVMIATAAISGAVLSPKLSLFH